MLQDVCGVRDWVPEPNCGAPNAPGRPMERGATVAEIALKLIIKIKKVVAQIMLLVFRMHKCWEGCSKCNKAILY